MSGSDGVTETKTEAWRTSMDGTTETRTSFGTSLRGHHFAIEVSQMGADSGPSAWSRPYATEADAAKVASIRADMALGERLPSQRENTADRIREAAAGREQPASAQAAQELNSAANSRYIAASMATGKPHLQAALKEKAMASVGKARAINQSAQIDVRQAAASYREALIAAAPAQPAETRTSTQSQRR